MMPKVGWVVVVPSSPDPFVYDSQIHFDKDEAIAALKDARGDDLADGDLAWSHYLDAMLCEITLVDVHPVPLKPGSPLPPPDPATRDMIYSLLRNPLKPCVHAVTEYKRVDGETRQLCTWCRHDVTEESKYWID